MTYVKSYICGCAYNVEPYLNDVFKNIQTLCELLDDYYLIICYDESDDNTYKLLKEMMKKHPKKMKIVQGNKELGNIRTQNIANARNNILKTIRDINFHDFEYFIMMDMDDVCASKIRSDVMNYIIESERNQKPLSWDALSFNRVIYYDLWALSIEPYSFSCKHYTNTRKIEHNMLECVKEEMGKAILRDPQNGLVPCISAFNGFSIYRKNKFINIKYEWNVHKTLTIYPKSKIDQMSRQVYAQPIGRHDDCEHRYFHIRASQLNQARICISPMCVF